MELKTGIFNTAACIALGWHSIHALCTIRKLKYLSRVTTKEDNIAYRTFASLTDDIESLCFVKECRELEGRFGTHYTSEVLTSPPDKMNSMLREMESEIYKKDHVLQVTKATHHHDLCKLADTGWKKLWDHSLDHGKICVTSLMNLVRILSYPKHATKPCPLCECDSEMESLVKHTMSRHLSSSESWDTLLEALCNLEPECFTTVLCFHKVFFSF